MKTFKDMREFYNYIEKVRQESRIFERETLKAMAELVEHDAKRKFGEYQGAVGPYNEWENLKPSTVNDRIRKGFSPDDPLYRTGDLMNSIHSKLDASGKIAVVGSDNPIMLWQEKGVPQNNLPARPALGPALFQNKKKLQKIASEMMFAWLTNKPLKTKIK